MTTNRNVYHNFESAVSNPQIGVVDITERLRSNDFWFETLGMSFPPAVIAFFAGVGWGRSFVELGTLALSANLAAVTFGFSFALVVYLFVLVLHILTTTNKYFAAKEVGEEEPAAVALIGTARNNQRARLTPEMRPLLVKFALHYDRVGTMGIEAWYRSKHLTRSEIESVRDYLPEIGAGRWLQDNQQTLTGWGIEQLPKWRQGVFADIVELSRTTPTPETAHGS